MIFIGLEEIQKEHNRSNKNDDCVSSVDAVSSNQKSGDKVAISNAIEDFLEEFDMSAILASTSKPIDAELQLKNEIEKFLNSPKNPNVSEGLEDAPTICKLYMKYNSIRSTEAICERMFSYAGELKKIPLFVYFVSVMCFVYNFCVWSTNWVWLIEF